MNRGRIRRSLKGMAKRMLKGSWGMAVLVLAAPLAVRLAFTGLLYAAAILLGLDPAAVAVGSGQSASAAQLMDYTRLSNITALLQWVLVTPLGLGVVAWFLGLLDGAPEPLSYAFCWLDSLGRVGKSLLLSLTVGLRMLLWSLLFLLPTVAGLAFFVTWRHETLPPLLPGWMTGSFAYEQITPSAVMSAEDLQLFFEQNPDLLVTFALCAVAVIAVLIALSLFLLRYLPARFLINRHPEQRCREILRESVRIMKGRKLEAAVFSLSFVGWAVVAVAAVELIAVPVRMLPAPALSVATVLLLPLPLLVLSAYYTLSLQLFCQYADDARRLSEGRAPYEVQLDAPPLPGVEGLSPFDPAGPEAGDPN
ncbi:MAG: DUF975 family protein [Clostridia bacterium]|nr:DUF975 family protein [Clostridia bacterium]